jgi:UDP-glucose 4-epimerase
VTIHELAERISRLTGSESELSFIPYEEVYRVGIEDTLHREPAIAKISSAIGWRPSLDLSQILQDIVDHARARKNRSEQETVEAS